MSEEILNTTTTESENTAAAEKAAADANTGATMEAAMDVNSGDAAGANMDDAADANMDAATDANMDDAADANMDDAADANMDDAADANMDDAADANMDDAADANMDDAADAHAVGPTSASTPEESMADYEKEINASLKQIHEGDILTGTVISVTEEEVTLDLKYYTEGVIRLEDYSADPNCALKECVHVGDEISATVVKRDGGQGQIMLSSKEANEVLSWDKLKAFKDNETNITVKVGGVVNAGVIAYVEGIRGFIPASKISLNYVEDLNEWLGKEIQVRVITVDKEANKLVLSARDILREKAREERKTRISNVQIGLVTEGTVESIQPYGAFINIGNGLSGLVHISQISDKRIKTPASVLAVGDKVKVKVINIKEGKLSLSMKALNDVTAEQVSEETFDLPKSESISTNLGSLFAKLKL